MTPLLTPLLALYARASPTVGRGAAPTLIARKAAAVAAFAAGTITFHVTVTAHVGAILNRGCLYRDGLGVG